MKTGPQSCGTRFWLACWTRRKRLRFRTHLCGTRRTFSRGGTRLAAIHRNYSSGVADAGL